MVRTKQTERKRYDTEMQRAEFPAESSESENSSDNSDQVEDTEPREGMEPRTESSETGSREVESREVEPTTNQQPHTKLCCLGTQLSVEWTPLSLITSVNEV